MSGSLSQLTNILDCSNAFLVTAGMSSALLQIIFARLTLLISWSWQDVKAVLSVCKAKFGAFSCQKRSPTRRRLNCSAIIHWKVGPRTPPSESTGSSTPFKCENEEVSKLIFAICEGHFTYLYWGVSWQGKTYLQWFLCGSALHRKWEFGTNLTIQVLRNKL